MHVTMHRASCASGVDNCRNIARPFRPGSPKSAKLVKQLLSSRGKRCQKRIAAAGGPALDATNIAAHGDARFDGNEIDPGGRRAAEVRPDKGSAVR